MREEWGKYIALNHPRPHLQMVNAETIEMENQSSLEVSDILTDKHKILLFFICL